MHIVVVFLVQIRRYLLLKLKFRKATWYNYSNKRLPSKRMLPLDGTEKMLPLDGRFIICITFIFLTTLKMT